ncbi:hypothetical protein BS47DRAFT_465403 [Hydnum rufescens UP504]|uniref:Uncharacterized protein n=1 Tax=Hydnum rufescens UP504 TaxID=1448309 RepID=A0A9P6DXM7_9AGAM|nr:hypothetical protein BS47DRAFT_465403 [Hydnum rufescens UP504]
MEWMARRVEAMKTYVYLAFAWGQDMAHLQPMRLLEIDVHNCHPQQLSRSPLPSTHELLRPPSPISTDSSSSPSALIPMHFPNTPPSNSDLQSSSTSPSALLLSGVSPRHLCRVTQRALCSVHFAD